MMGAITGDIVGSTFEFNATKSPEFSLLPAGSRFTDDSVLTVATAFSLLADGDYAANYKLFARLYPLAGYGERFRMWMGGDSTEPYGSWGNGSAMRVSPVGWFLDDEKAVLQEAERSASVTHNHPEGIKGAQAIALGVFLLRHGADKATLKSEISSRFGYNLDRKVADIRPDYTFQVSCQKSVPESIICFLESADWEEAVRLAVSLGGDADTQACIAGALAEAAFGPPPAHVIEFSRNILTEHLLQVIDEFLEHLNR